MIHLFQTPGVQSSQRRRHQFVGLLQRRNRQEGKRDHFVWGTEKVMRLGPVTLGTVLAAAVARPERKHNNNRRPISTLIVLLRISVHWAHFGADTIAFTINQSACVLFLTPFPQANNPLSPTAPTEMTA
jgi:hypothetical protein